jgi:repressor LexA
MNFWVLFAVTYTVVNSDTPRRTASMSSSPCTSRNVNVHTTKPPSSKIGGRHPRAVEGPSCRLEGLGELITRSSSHLQIHLDVLIWSTSNAVQFDRPSLDRNEEALYRHARPVPGVIYYYGKIHGRAPSESEMQQYFRVSPPSVHRMILALEAHGLIERTPGQARSIRLLIPRGGLPDLG